LFRCPVLFYFHASGPFEKRVCRGAVAVFPRYVGLDTRDLRPKLFDVEPQFIDPQAIEQQRVQAAAAWGRSIVFQGHFFLLRRFCGRWRFSHALSFHHNTANAA
jgi:hypothetical protein